MNFAISTAFNSTMAQRLGCVAVEKGTKGIIARCFNTVIGTIPSNKTMNTASLHAEMGVFESVLRHYGLLEQARDMLTGKRCERGGQDRYPTPNRRLF
jgi:hypothetical protein